MFAKVAPLLTFAVLTVLLAAGCDSSVPTAGEQKAEPTRVIAKPLEFETQSTRVEAVGTSRAIKSVDLQPESSGEVVAINFQPGQHVVTGDVLVELDQRDEVLAVELARVRLREAQRLFERYQQSAGSGAVLPTQIDAAETEVDSARIELDQAKVALDHRSIEAAFDGHVGITEIDAGDRVEPSTLITTLDDRSALLVTFTVPESLIADLRVGQTVAIATWRDRNAAFSGEIVDIGSRIDPASRTFVARARVNNEADKLRPGQSFRVTIEIEGKAFPVVAETSLQWGAEGAFVWTVVDGAAHRVAVDIVQRNEGRILVDADLQPGQIIVVEGIQRMREGIAVEQ
jgi:RND family efflux transporter MFP subunit